MASKLMLRQKQLEMADRMMSLIFVCCVLVDLSFGSTAPRINDLMTVRHFPPKKYHPPSETILLQRSSETSDPINTKNNRGKITYIILEPQRERTVPTEEFSRPSLLTSRKNGRTWKNPTSANPWSTLYSPTSSNTGKDSPSQLHMASSLVREYSPNNSPKELFQSSPIQKSTEFKMDSPQHRKEPELHHRPSSRDPSPSKTPEELEDVRLANEHFLKMRKEGRCKIPRREMVCANHTYPSTTKEYLPRCTILHRCNDWAGCCESDTLTCSPKTIQEVTLSFYVIYHNTQANPVSLEDSVERLLYENHTECQCISVSKAPIHTSMVGLLRDQTDRNQVIHTSVGVLPSKAKDTTSEPDPKCRGCPEPYHRREYQDGRCGCDCFDKHKSCLKVKRGREPLVEHEKRCIETGRCHVPDCEYGFYDTTNGRCPKKPDNGQKSIKHGSHQQKPAIPDYHRWSFVERD